MKALSLTQPWATLIAIGAKRIVTRSWQVFARGPIAIHASKAMPWACREFAYADPAGQVLNDAGILLGNNCAALPRGAIVAVARIVSCAPTEQVAFDLTQPAQVLEREFGDYTPGRWAIFLQGIKPLAEPIPCKGALGLWDVPPLILPQLAPLLSPGRTVVIPPDDLVTVDGRRGSPRPSRQHGLAIRGKEEFS